MKIYIEKETGVILNIQDLFILPENIVDRPIAEFIGDRYEREEIEEHEISDEYKNSFIQDDLYSNILRFVENEIIHEKGLHSGIINNNIQKVEQELQSTDDLIIQAYEESLLNKSMRTFSTDPVSHNEQENIQIIIQKRKELRNKLKQLYEMKNMSQQISSKRE